MSLNFCKSCSIMLVQKCPLHDEKPRTVQRRFPRQSGVHFVFFFPLLSSQGVKPFLSRRQDWSMVSASYMLLLCLHRWQCSTPGVKCVFIPSRSHCCTEGIFFFLLLIVLREMLMYKSTSRAELHKQAGSAVLVDLEIWVLKKILRVYLDKQRAFSFFFSSAALKPSSVIPVLLC